jgi:thiol-disulfide isomerase/thioredoxin
MVRLRPALVAVVGVVLLLAGCGEEPAAGGAPATTTSSGPVPDDAATSATTVTEPPRRVPEQLEFTARTVDGAEFSGASLAGRAAVLWFWAPWCPKCQAEAPGIGAAARAAGDVRFVGVAAQDEVAAMRDFVARFDLGSFPHIADTDTAVWQRFGVTSQPAYAFVSANGDIEVETSQLDEDELLARVNALR